MDQHPDSEQILAFSARGMDLEETLRIDRHMETCAECRERWAVVRNGSFGTLIPAESPRHLSYQQLKEIVQNPASSNRQIEGPLTGAEIETHLRNCVRCRAEIEELRGFATMLREPEEDSAPQNVPRSKWRIWMAPPAWKWASVAAVAALAFGIAWLAPVTRSLSAQLAGAEKISDEGVGYMLDSQGDVLGWPGLPESYRRAIRAALTGAAPTGGIDIEETRKRFGPSHLIMGTAYWQDGMKEQACAEFEQLQHANAQARLIDRLVESCSTK